MIRSFTGGAKGMDDFAQRFFGGKPGDYSARSFDFDEVVRTLNAITPYDWAGFLNTRLTAKVSAAPLNGLIMGGYKLTYTDTQTPFIKDAEKRAKELSLTYSLGGSIAKGKLTAVIWDGPLFNAGMAVGNEVLAVGGKSYSDDVMKDAITAARGGKDPIRLIVKSGDRKLALELEEKGYDWITKGEVVTA